MMQASNFYIALWKPETDEVSFPILYENNQKILGQSTTSKRGLTEYIIKTKKPLLIEENVKEAVESLGFEHYGKEAQSWLGVPIIAGAQAIGMIAVQSYRKPDQLKKSFDHNHLKILSAIASQASVAFQNAWLYTQTDKALAQRVQELNSILNTTHDGIMLLDIELRVV
jgi:GAF domain-containing protein